MLLQYFTLQFNKNNLVLIYSLEQMSTNFGVRDMFTSMNRSADYGIQGYEAQKKYCDPLQQIKQRQYAKIKKGQKSRNHQTKRGNYLDDQSNLHKFCPGPGTYKNQMEWPQKQKLKRNIGDKMTYIDQIIKYQKRNKGPAPGTYNIIKTLKQLEKEKKILASRKPQPRDKINYLDQVQFEATQTPGVGNYNPKVRAKTQTSNSKMNKKPQQWRKVHEQKQKKKPQKSPDMRTYNPQPSFDIFESITKKKQNKNFLGKTQRFKTAGSTSGLPPGKYTVIQNWRGKPISKTKLQRHGLESVSKGLSKSVYYH